MTDAVCQAVKKQLPQVVKGMIEAGKRLILLKAHKTPSEFLLSIERIEISPSQADRLIRATLQYEQGAGAVAADDLLILAADLILEDAARQALTNTKH